jgi:hypothetical protein
MKLKSFGCSFTYGNDLHDCQDELPSESTWPALLAKNKQFEYECHARPGIGNLQIMNGVLDQAQLNDPAVFVINWTWLDRFDYLDPLYENWTTLRPDGNQKEHQLYYQYFYNQYHTMLVNSSYILTTISILKSQKIDFFMTALDSTLFETIDPNWQDPKSIQLIQKKIKPYINWFEEMSFLDWSRKHKFPESKLWHPLEEAHQVASEYIIKVFDKQKINDPTQQVRV